MSDDKNKDKNENENYTFYDEKQKLNIVKQIDDLEEVVWEN